MFKNIGILLTTLLLVFYTIHSFAISPGAGQAQVRNNMQELQQNKQRMQHMQQMKQQQQMMQHNKMHNPQNMQRQY
jgi:hypothetical protein